MGRGAWGRGLVTVHGVPKSQTEHKAQALYIVNKWPLGM